VLTAPGVTQKERDFFGRVLKKRENPSSDVTEPKEGKRTSPSWGKGMEKRSDENVLCGEGRARGPAERKRGRDYIFLRYIPRREKESEKLGGMGGRKGMEKEDLSEGQILRTGVATNPELCRAKKKREPLFQTRKKGEVL